jgi:glycosyltransferase involved in cell wall biosynthesis
MLSLVIPVYKNEENLPRLFGELDRLAEQIPDIEIVFVVDGSPDASLAVLQRQLPNWHVRSQLIELSRNFGSFSAITAGLASARGEYMAVISADLQEPPALVVQFHELLSAGTTDVVLGHRTRRADPWLARVTSDLFWGLYRRFVVRDIPKGGIDVFGCTRQVRDRLVELREVTTNLIALLLWVGFRRSYIPYERHPRLEGRSAWTFVARLRYATDSIFAFTDLPIRALLFIGLAGVTLALTSGLTVFVMWWLGRIPVLGYTPLMLVITFFGGSTALGLGIIGQYLWLSLQNSRGRPNYIVKSTWTYDRARGPRRADVHAVRE